MRQGAGGGGAGARAHARRAASRSRPAGRADHGRGHRQGADAGRSAPAGRGNRQAADGLVACAGRAPDEDRARQAQRDARRLFRLCLVDGIARRETARAQVVQRLVDAGRPGGARRPVALSAPGEARSRRAHSADVDERRAAARGHPRAASKRASARLYGPGIVTSFAEDPALIGGVRITVGSDVYDGSVRAGLAALEARF